MTTRAKVIFVLTVVLAAMLGFRVGFVACLHLKTSSPEMQREQKLGQSGNASETVRAAVVDRLRTLQDGYTKRDPKNIDSFAQSLLAKDGDVLVLGTNGGVEEWVRGVPGAKNFIVNDWLKWGNVRFDTDQATVWSSGDVAWMATIGTVDWGKGVVRPIRLSAVLTLEDGRWVFRQMHFQYDDNDPTTADLRHPSTYIRLLADKFH
ncbi:MAG TPA: nuclear transport factor 2 family protein [Terracidiphilus sp.]|jgi:hypothetical protein|nr:nuclear transport factor 2 family protein [Terracidiphilus sp.]